MRKLMTIGAASAGAALMLAVGSGTATADTMSKPWSESVSGASGSGTIKTVWGKDGGKVTATGKLKVTAAKGCYTISVGEGFIGKPTGPQVWNKAPQKQCGPGTIDVTATLPPNQFWDGPWVHICKDGDDSRACKS
ncbi:hypothetical protein [Streptomyces natalensis]|uniref:Secreted protein n=1 Tax=Streptomyces natalensis ATCC 27448 TaxID=1240678 RepID=A0A0D7CGG8_9ACTN|nr:hypothetical protein [Streptomyces natalensis]KIZ15283.1 hypothetical protein SNA_27240 [Streptomyces natalensis ATCC 27448]